MVAQAHEAGALVLVDGAQAVPHLPVDVQDIGADFYVFSGHKMLAPAGSGALWARRELLEAMPPFMSGGDMINSVHLRHTTFNDIPYKFEAGTPDVAAAIGLGAAVDYLEGIGMDRVAAHEEALTAYALEVLPREVPGIRIHGPARSRPSVPASSPSRCPRRTLTTWPRCSTARRSPSAPATTARSRSTSDSGETATGRASFNVYSGTDDIDRLAAGLRGVQRIFGRAPATRRRHRLGSQAPHRVPCTGPWTTFTATRSSSTTASPTTSARWTRPMPSTKATTRCAATASR